MRSAVPFQFTSFLWWEEEKASPQWAVASIKTDQTAPTSGCALPHSRSQGSTGALCQRQPLLPPLLELRCPSRRGTRTVPILANALGQSETSLLYFLYFTDSKLRQIEIRLPLKITQEICDRAGSWPLASQIPCLMVRRCSWPLCPPAPASHLRPRQAKRWKSAVSGG